MFELMKTKLRNVAVVRPGGNDTALVFDDIHPNNYKAINSYIQESNPEIEQVMFIKNDTPYPRGIMAGGEFCGNSARSLGYYLLKGKDGDITLSVSGASRPLTVRVRNKKANTEMPIINDTSSVSFVTETNSLVKLEGITHLVLEPDSEQAQSMQKISGIKEQKIFARQLLTECSLQNEAAAGIIALTKDQGGLAITPFVYVKSIDTFYAETACGSGSVAVGLTLAKRYSRSISNLEIRQPSGHFIFVDVKFANGCFTKASIDGGVDIIYEGCF